MEFTCSECKGTLKKQGRNLTCTSCGRTVPLSYGRIKVTKEVDMNDNTKDKEVLLG